MRKLIGRDAHSLRIAGELLGQVGRNLSSWERVLQLAASMASERQAHWVASIRNHHGHRRPEGAYRRRHGVAASRVVRWTGSRQRFRVHRDCTADITVIPRRRTAAIEQKEISLPLPQGMLGAYILYNGKPCSE